MRRFSLIIATSAALAVLTQTAGAYADDDPAAPSADPSAQMVLNDIADAIAEQPAAPVAMDPVATDSSEGATGAELAADLPESGSQPAEATTSAGTLTMDVPATGSDLAAANGTTALFAGTAPDTTVAVQETTEGLRALVHIDSTDAPERFNFPIGGDVTRLEPTTGGGVAALNAVGGVIATAPTPWATDANGVAVPTHYEINGTTLIQVVNHHAGPYAYPVVADPSFKVGWTGLFAHWSRGEVKWMAGLGLTALAGAVATMCAGPHIVLCGAAVAGIYYVLLGVSDATVDFMYNHGYRLTTRLTPYTKTYWEKR